MVCTFFGHRDTPFSLENKLLDTLIHLIEENNVNTFYVGTHGNFDCIAYSALKKLTMHYSHIQYNVVLAYVPLPNQKSEFNNTLLPEGIEAVPKRFAINFRNKWMIDKSDYVVSYISHNTGSASKFMNIAKKNGKQIINLS